MSGDLSDYPEENESNVWKASRKALWSSEVYSDELHSERVGETEMKTMLNAKVYKIKLWLHRALRRKGLPLCCGAEGPCFRRGRRQRQNTAYVDDERNWVIACDDCMVIIQEKWNEMWRDYYGGVR